MSTTSKIERHKAPFRPNWQELVLRRQKPSSCCNADMVAEKLTKCDSVSFFRPRHDKEHFDRLSLFWFKYILPKPEAVVAKCWCAGHVVRHSGLD